MNVALKLDQTAPRSPRIRLGGFAILARAIDKGRATLQGNNGEYHFDCPLDNMLFGFKEVKGPEIYKLIEMHASDEEILAWLNANGVKKSASEITAWSDSMEAYNPISNPEKKEWFEGVCKELGIDPVKNTLFDMLEEDDKQSF